MTTFLGRGALFAFAAGVLVLLIIGVAWRRRIRAVPVVQESEQPFIAVSELNPLALDLDPRAAARAPRDPSAAGRARRALLGQGRAALPTVGPKPYR